MFESLFKYWKNSILSRIISILNSLESKISNQLKTLKLNLFEIASELKQQIDFNTRRSLINRGFFDRQKQV
jgi:hypothetical protein